MFSQSQSIALAFVAIAALAGHSGGAVIHVVPPEPIISANTPENRNEPFDVNDDGAVDFIVQNDGFAVIFLQLGDNRVSSRVNDFGGRHVPDGYFIGATLAPGLDWASVIVGGGLEFGASVQTCSGGFCVGDFSALGAFLGLEFDIGGATHYGWARLQGDPFFVRLEVQEWAYETVPGRPIASGAIPEPGGAALAAFAAALLALRRRR
jgi:hypothetical protein